MATGAHAADMSAPVYKAPPTPLPAWSWTGFYVGGTVGGVGGHSSISDSPASSNTFLVGATTSINQIGFIGGLEAGANWQINNLVLGIEGDISWSSLRSTVAVPMTNFGVGDTYSSRLDTLGTVRGRIGWAVDRALVYGTGGAAFANLKEQFTDITGPFTATPSSSVTGWTAGAGIEYALTDHWTAKAEYLHVGFPTRTAFGNTGFGYAFNFKDSLDIGRVGINYKF